MRSATAVDEHDVDRGDPVEFVAGDRGRPRARGQLDVLAQARVEAGQDAVHGGAGRGIRHHGAQRPRGEHGERLAGDVVQGLGKVVADADERLLLPTPHGVDVVVERRAAR